MKPLLLASTLLTATTLPAQTNTFPSSGNVGIGTTSPAHALDVHGTIHTPHSGIFGDGHWSSEGIHYEAISTYGGATIRGDSMVIGKFSIGTWTQSAPGDGLFVGGDSVLNGKVGIGTASPSAPFQVRVIDNDALAIFSNLNNSVALQTLLDGQSLSDYNYGGAENRLLLQPLVGNVGIGTTNPTEKLTVTGGNVSIASYAYTKQLIGNINGYTWGNHNYHGSIGPESAGWDTFMFSANWQGVTNDTDNFDNPAFYASAIGLNRDGLIRFFTTNAHSTAPVIRMVINSLGNVGIGITNPTHKLAVNGTIKAKEVIVETTGWSDYVFADDYSLAPLSEVEAHIKANRHLPGIPSAAQVASEGVSVGELQTKLLAKIEELTLHQIAQEKQLTALKIENSNLQSRVHQLETR